MTVSLISDQADLWCLMQDSPMWYFMPDTHMIYFNVIWRMSIIQIKWVSILWSTCLDWILGNWTLWPYLTQNMAHTVDCRYNAVQYEIILHTSLHWLGQSIYYCLNPQNTSHISPYLASYGLFFFQDLGENWPRWKDAALYLHSTKSCWSACTCIITSAAAWRGERPE